jgi:uncharacterized protein with LGFP repeats
LLGTPDGQGWYSHFERGSIYAQGGATQAFVVSGAIRDKWASLGWERGGLGFPISNETDDGAGGRIQTFERGTIFWSAATGPLFVHWSGL